MRGNWLISIPGFRATMQPSARSVTILSAVACVIVGSALIVPILSWTIIALAIAVPLIARPIAPGRAIHVLAINTVTVAALTFTTWAGMSAYWAPRSASALQVSGILLAVVLLTHLACRLVAELTVDSQRAFGAGVVVAMLLAGAFCAIESWSDQAIGRLVFNTFPILRGNGDHMIFDGSKIVSIGDIVMNRRVCLWILLFWPTVAIAMQLFQDAKRTRWLLASLVVTAVAILSATTHKSSILAFAVSACVGAGWIMSPRRALLLVGAFWCAAVLLVVPLTASLYDWGFSQNPKLFHSARERIALWGYTAHEVSKHPVVGFGANAVRETDNVIGASAERDKSTYVASRPGFHSHNFYLQVWYELGAVGAFAFLAMGLTGLLMTRYAEPSSRKFVAIEMAAIAAMIATSYGLWQFWFQAAIASSIVLTALWLRLRKTASVEIG